MPDFHAPDTTAKFANIVSASFGFLGTVVLSISGYGLAPLQGSFFGSPEITKANQQTMRLNRLRRQGQRVGLAMLAISFASQAITSFLP